MSAQDIPAEVVERMVALVHRMRDLNQYVAYNSIAKRVCDEASAIAALLPEPVDPDLIEARESVCVRDHDRWPQSPWHLNQAERVRAGHEDGSYRVIDTLAGIKRGRELAKRDPSHAA